MWALATSPSLIRPSPVVMPIVWLIVRLIVRLKTRLLDRRPNAPIGF